MPTTITGQVQIRGANANAGVPLIRIDAWDGDGFASSDDFLGTAYPDGQGRFTLTIDEAWRRDDPAGQKIPDVYFRLYSGDLEIPHTISKAETKWNAKKDQFTVLLKIDQPARPDRTNEILNRIDAVNNSLGAYITYAPTAFENGSGTNHRVSEIEGVVSAAMRDVLGKHIRPNDTKALQSSFDRVFEFADEEGNRVVRWKAPTYSAQTELGAELTGAQASLYEYARNSADELKRRIDMLRPLGLDTDDDLVHASRSSFLTELDDLVEALASKIELRPVRIDGAFTRLDEYLADIEQAFGFKEDNIQTVDDERAHTDFFIARQYLKSMAGAWVTFKQEQKLTFGGRLVKLEHLLSVVAEGVEEAFAAMDALNFDSAERQAVVLNLNGVTISVEEICVWILAFSNAKAPRILKDGGKSSLPRLLSEANQLHKLVSGLSAEQDSRLAHQRVNQTLLELVKYLDQVVKILT